MPALSSKELAERRGAVLKNGNIKKIYEEYKKRERA